jgi:acyl-CoA thioester hydrolase
MKELNFQDFPLQTFDKLRYSDTDRQGHVNNAVFSTFLETGRVEFLYDSKAFDLSGQFSYVIASLQLNFRREITWPGRVDIGTGLMKVGNSSVRIYQRLFQNGQCAAEAETVIVQVENATGKSAPLTEAARAAMMQWLLDGFPNQDL